MQKKLLIIVMAIMLFISSLIIPQRNAQAEAFTIAVGGAAISATAVYIIGALAVGGLAVAAGIEYGDEINAHAKRVWETASDSIKSAFSAALTGASNGIVNLTGELKTWFHNAAKQVASSVVVSHNYTTDTGVTYTPITSGYKEIKVTGGREFNSNYTAYDEVIAPGAGYKIVMQTANGLLTFNSIDVSLYETGGLVIRDPNNYSEYLLPYLIPGYTSNIYNIRDRLGYDYAVGIANQLRNATTPQEAISVLNKLGFSKMAVLSQQTLDKYYNDVVVQMDSVFGAGSLGLNLPSDNLYLPKTDAAGNVTYDLPNVVVLDVAGTMIPALPIVDMPGYYIDINTGDILTQNPDVPIEDVPTGTIPGVVAPSLPTTDSGLFDKLWDWLKRLLDAILGLPAKLIELLKTLLTTVFVPDEAFWSDNFNEIKLLLEEKLDTESYMSLLDSLENITSPTFSDVTIPSILGSGEMVIIKASYINNALPTIHNWIKGLFFVLLVFYNLNNVYKLLRGGDITSAIERRERSNKD